MMLDRRDWPRNLEDCLAKPVKPFCPSACCFRVICPDWIQQGAEALFAEGTLTAREQCIWFQRLMQLHSQRVGNPPPATSEELVRRLEQRAEREAIEESA